MYVPLILFNILGGLEFCVSGPKGHTRSGDSVGGITAFNIVVLTDMAYYSQRIQGKISKERGSWDKTIKSEGNQAQVSKTLLPVKSHRMHLIPPLSCNNPCKMLSMGKLIRDFMPRVLTGCVDFVFLTSTKVLKENRYLPQTKLFAQIV